MDQPDAVMAGAVLFSRFAYPPDALGRTDEDRARDLVDDGHRFDAMRRLGTLARGYESALPYLELIAEGAQVDDPLDLRAVEAYWIGSPLLDQVDPDSLQNYLRQRAQSLGEPDEQARPGHPLLRPHHNFHVLAATPWAAPHRTAHTPVEALDQCRIRWGRVLAVDATTATVRSRPLVRVDGVLGLGEARLEQAHVRPHGPGSAPRVERGDWCALHWDWVCDRISTRQLVQLRRYTRMQIEALNAAL